MSKIHDISRGVILYRLQSFLSLQIDLNFGHLSSCGTSDCINMSNRLHFLDSFENRYLNICSFVVMIDRKC